MTKKEQKNILLLGAVGIGLYLLMRPKPAALSPTKSVPGPTRTQYASAAVLGTRRSGIGACYEHSHSTI